MFRLISTNATAVRPVLLKVRSANLPATVNWSTNNVCISNNLNFFKSNSTIPSTNTKKLDEIIEKSKKNPLIAQSFDKETFSKLDHFNNLLTEARSLYKDTKDPEALQAYNSTMNQLFTLFDDPDLRNSFTSYELEQYIKTVNANIFNHRTLRLSGSKNRDKDQFNQTFTDELALKTAVLNIGEIILSGQLSSILSTTSISTLFFSMSQYRFFPEIINIWESGVENSETSSFYLSHDILAVILPICYTTNRFSYEEILKIYELNIKPDEPVHHSLLCSIGKIAIMANDYARGLDCLEELLHTYEKRVVNPHRLISSLRDLHLTFIGQSKDISISRHFFDKVIMQGLPYNVILKVPHVISLMENCYLTNEPLETILYFWKSTINHYNTKSEQQFGPLNSRYSNLNNTLFKIFFKIYPELTNDSFEKLREIIVSYNEIRDIDETFLNSIVNNYTWNSKDILQQLIENYSIYNISKTPVAYRIILKKAGFLKDYSIEEILQKWNDCLKNLDKDKYNYIPIADWSALRDATILSEFSQERKQLYLSILNVYHDYMQNKNQCLRFVGNWVKNVDHSPEIKQITTGEPHFEYEDLVKSTMPTFTNLHPNVNYKKITEEIVLHRRNRQ